MQTVFANWGEEHLNALAHVSTMLYYYYVLADKDGSLHDEIISF